MPIILVYRSLFVENLNSAGRIIKMNSINSKCVYLGVFTFLLLMPGCKFGSNREWYLERANVSIEVIEKTHFLFCTDNGCYPPYELKHSNALKYYFDPVSKTVPIYDAKNYFGSISNDDLQFKNSNDIRVAFLTAIDSTGSKYIEIRYFNVQTQELSKRSMVFKINSEDRLLSVKCSGASCTADKLDIKNYYFEKNGTSDQISIQFINQNEISSNQTLMNKSQKSTKDVSKETDNPRHQLKNNTISLKENAINAVNKIKNITSPKVRFGDDLYDVGDVLFYQESDNVYRKIELLKIQNKKVKVRLEDKSSAWLPISKLMTKFGVNEAKEVKRKAEEKRRRRIAEEERAKTKDCCCYIKSTGFWGVSLYSQKWVPTNQCHAEDWEGYNEYRGTLALQGECKHHEKNNCREF